MNWFIYALICAIGYFLIGLISFYFVTENKFNSLAYNTAQHIYCLIFALLTLIIINSIDKKLFNSIIFDLKRIFDFTNIKNVLGVIFLGFPMAVANTSVYEAQKLAANANNINPGIPSAIGQFYLVGQTIIAYLVYNIKISKINAIGMGLFLFAIFLLGNTDSGKEGFTTLFSKKTLWIPFSILSIVAYCIGSFPPYMFQRIHKGINPLIICFVQFIGEACTGLLAGLYLKLFGTEGIKKDSIFYKLNHDIYKMCTGEITWVVFLIALTLITYISVGAQYKSWIMASSPGLANTVQALYVVFFAVYKVITSHLTVNTSGIFGLLFSIVSIYLINL